MSLTLRACGEEVNVCGEPCQQAISQALSEEESFSQLSKMGDDFTLTSLNFSSDGVFVRKATLNEIRRSALEKLATALVARHEEGMANLAEKKEISLEFDKKEAKNNQKILIFNDLDEIKGNFAQNEIVVLSPKEYEVKKIIDFCKGFEGMLYLDTPIYAEEGDIKILKTLLSACDNLGLVANNYYCLTLTEPSKVIIGSELNVYNSLSVRFYQKLGYKNIILSKEDFGALSLKDKTGLFLHQNVKEKLIYFKHCPVKEHLGGDCSNCRFKEGITYTLRGKKFVLERVKLAGCLFHLRSDSEGSCYQEGFGRVVEKR